MKALQLVHEHPGETEYITSSTDAVVGDEERFIIGRITVTVESA